MVTGLRTATAFPTRGRVAQDLSANTMTGEQTKIDASYNLGIYWDVLSELHEGVSRKLKRGGSELYTDSP